MAPLGVFSDMEPGGDVVRPPLHLLRRVPPCVCQALGCVHESRGKSWPLIAHLLQALTRQHSR